MVAYYTSAFYTFIRDHVITGCLKFEKLEGRPVVGDTFLGSIQFNSLAIGHYCIIYK